MTHNNTGLLLSRYLDGETSEDESKYALELVARDEEAAGELKELEQTSRMVGDAVDSLEPDDALLANVMFRISREVRPAKKKTKSRRLRWILASAAAAAIATLAILFVPEILRRPVEEPEKQIADTADETLPRTDELIAKPLLVRVDDLEGPVLVVTPDGKKETLNYGANVISANSNIYTNAGRAQFTVREQRIRANRDTTFNNDTLAEDNVNFVLNKGQLYVDCKPAKDAPGVLVTTGLGTLEAQDATFDVKIDTYVSTETPPSYNYDSGAEKHPSEPAYLLAAPAEENEAPEAADKEITRLTVTVSRGIVDYSRGKTTLRLKAPSVFITDTTGRREMRSPERRVVEEQNDWWNTRPLSEPPEPKTPESEPPGKSGKSGGNSKG
ncbi:MAG: hypothetical protein ABIH04_02730 [Planctomycetota bacterium]